MAKLHKGGWRHWNNAGAGCQATQRFPSPPTTCTSVVRRLRCFRRPYTSLEDALMKRLMLLTLAGLILLPSAWAGDDQDKKNGDEKAFTIEGKLTKDDPPDRVRKEHPHKVHHYKMAAGSVYAVKLVSKDPKTFDIYLRIEDSAGKNLAEDDDSGGWPNAQVLFKAPKDDAYQIIATAYSGVGDYTLTIREI